MGHQCFLQAVQLNPACFDWANVEQSNVGLASETRFFLIADPENQNSVLITIEQLERIILQKDFCFDLVDVIGIERRRLFRKKN